jgi:hypothetical protein
MSKEVSNLREVKTVVAEYEVITMRALEVRPGKLEIGAAHRVPREILDQMQSQLPDDDWEPVDHKFSRVDDHIVLSVMWRRLTR